MDEQKQESSTKVTYVQRTHKDRVFCDLFSDKENALSLYNAINETNYTDVENLQIITLTDTIYMTMNNDVAMCFHDAMNLFEHQSSVNPNMPLRGLMYFAREYESWLTANEKDIYGRRLIRIPAPKFYVLYNGGSKMPEQKVYRLSDAFEKPSEGYEWTAYLYNINAGHNQALMQRCPTLYGYSEFIGMINAGYKKGESIEEAVGKAMDVCIEQGYLREYLLKHKSEVKQMILTEYNEKLHDETIREEGRAEGREEGREEGADELATLINRLICENKFDEIKKATNNKVYRHELLRRYRIR